jgi:hypothetical protein
LGDSILPSVYVDTDIYDSKGKINFIKSLADVLSIDDWLLDVPPCAGVYLPSIHSIHNRIESFSAS